MTPIFNSIRDRLQDEDPDTLAAVVDVLATVSREATKWTRRCDDAKRIPDLIHDVMGFVNELNNEDSDDDDWTYEDGVLQRCSKG